MIRSHFLGLRSLSAALLAALTIFSLAACNGPTTVENPDGVGKYKVAVSMDPQTLKPPQLATLTYELTDTTNGKPFGRYTTVLGALFHNILISKDLLHFKHSFTNNVILNGVSLQTYFPAQGKYNSYAIFQPEGGDVTVYPHTIQSGSEGDAPNLAADVDKSKTNRQYGLRLDLLTGPTPIKAGQRSQIAVYVSELGRPVTGLWSFLDAPGYLWIIDSNGENFTWEPGVSPGTVLSGTNATPPAAPTLLPNLNDLLATRTAQPVPTLSAVQATAQSSVLGPQGAQPDVTYGPYVVFNHQFPAAGLYKVWFEFNYRGQVIQSDWVVQVEP